MSQAFVFKNFDDCRNFLNFIKLLQQLNVKIKYYCDVITQLDENTQDCETYLSENNEAIIHRASFLYVYRLFLYTEEN